MHRGMVSNAAASNGSTATEDKDGGIGPSVADILEGPECLGANHASRGINSPLLVADLPEAG